MVNIKEIDDNQTQGNILDKIDINLDTEQDFDKHVFSHRDPIKDIVFSHSFIEKEVSKYDLSFDGCANCSVVSKHFQDLQGAADAVASKEVTWHQLPGAVMSCPAPSMTIKLTDPQNMNLPLIKT